MRTLIARLGLEFENSRLCKKISDVTARSTRTSNKEINASLLLAGNRILRVMLNAYGVAACIRLLCYALAKSRDWYF